MLQRSPTYIAALPDTDPFAARTNKMLPEKAAYVATRWKAITQAQCGTRSPGSFPNYFRKVLRNMAERRLPEGYDIDKHFSPSYKPWDQRCAWRRTATCSGRSARARRTS